MGFLKIKTVYKFDTLVLIISLFSIPSLIGLQPFLPRVLEILVISFKLVIGPLLILVLTRKRTNYDWIFLMVGYILLMTSLNPPKVFYDYKLTFLNIFSSIAFFMLGDFIVNREKNNSVFRYISYGVNVFNIITLVLYFLIYTKIIDIQDVYSVVKRLQDTNLQRFALGNAIEVPFGMTCLLFSCLVLAKDDEMFLFSVSLNFLLAIISESRVVVIIAFLLFLREFYRSRINAKFIFILFAVILLPLIIKYLSAIYFSYLSRLSGNDLGSMKGRFFLLDLFIKNQNLPGIIFGHGLTSASSLVKINTGIYRSVESVFLQMIYDTGILGFFILFSPVILKNLKYLIYGEYRIALLFVYIQILLFLPINGFMPITFFLFGVCSSIKTNKLVL